MKELDTKLETTEWEGKTVELVPYCYCPRCIDLRPPLKKDQIYTSKICSEEFKRLFNASHYVWGVGATDEDRRNI